MISDFLESGVNPEVFKHVSRMPADALLKLRARRHQPHESSSLQGRLAPPQLAGLYPGLCR